MRRLALAFTVLALVTAGRSQPLAAQTAASGQQSPVLRTPWGDPDLQGLWNYGTNTPLQRPPKYAGREWLTEAEVSAANLESAARPARRDKRALIAFCEDLLD